MIVRGGEIAPVWLDGLGVEELFERLRDYLKAFLAEKEVEQEIDEAAWPFALERTTKWLWHAAMEEVLAAIAPARQIRVVPAGALALLPLHAAWRFDRSAPTGRRFACDSTVFTYLPNARIGIEAERLAASLPVSRLLAVADPDLEKAEHEAALAAAAFAPNACTLPVDQRTRSAVLAAMAESDVVHFACHGIADLREPTRSALLLADNSRLTVADLLAHRFRARLIVLSACETAVTGIDLLDEFVGLPAAVLQAGAAGVIASMWKVADADTMLLMAEFYRRWRDLNIPPAEALRDAQVWIRDSTNAEKAAAYDALLADGTRSGIPQETLIALRAEVAGADSEEQSFADLVGWAAFTHVGA